MKKILSLLGTITLIGTSTTSLVSCNTAPQYNEKQLKELKDKNNININENILEWIAPQETPFNQVDNKWYFVVWRDSESSNWNINKFNNNEKLDTGQTYNINEKLYLFNGNFASNLKIDLQVILKNGVPLGWFFDRDNSFLKSVHRWDGNGEPNTPIIDPKTGQIKS